VQGVSFIFSKIVKLVQVSGSFNTALRVLNYRLAAFGVSHGRTPDGIDAPWPPTNQSSCVASDWQQACD
jgi:hypothetical protein